MGSAIITPSQPIIEHKFGITPQVASLGLSMYVLGYGIGPMIFSPLSEMPSIGRNPPYIVTFSIFMAISIGTACVNNFPALIVLRFLRKLPPSLLSITRAVLKIMILIRNRGLFWLALPRNRRRLHRRHLLSASSALLPHRMGCLRNCRSCPGSHHLRLQRTRNQLALGTLGDRLARSSHLYPALHLSSRNFRRCYPPATRSPPAQAYW